MYVEQVFNGFPLCPFLQKIQEYQKETSRPIYMSMKKKREISCPVEMELLDNIQNNLLPHHLEMVRQYIPSSVYKKARETFLWSQYHKLKRKISFIENAVQQVQDHDPFYLSMDDIHEADMMLTDMISKMMYYRDLV